MSTPGSVTIVAQLKDQLSKELLKIQSSNESNTPLSNTFYERCLDLLHALDKIPINLSTLTTTLIGTVVSKFKNCQDEAVASAAKKIVKKWKAVAKQEGAKKSTPPKISNTPTAKKSVLKPNPTPQRRVSSSSVESTPTFSIPEQWNSLPPLRKNICTKICNILTVHAGTLKESDPIKTSTEIEMEMNTFFHGTNSKYKDKARSLCFNMKRNSSLCCEILIGSIIPSKLILLSTEELATTERKAEREKLEEMSQESRRLDWDTANEDKINEMCGIKGDLLKASLFTCSRCKSIKTTSTQKQTRSADEPMTVFVFCTNCGKRWKC